MRGTFAVWKNHKGFSLVQTLVAVSIMGGLSLGTMTMLDTAQKSSRRMELRSVAGQVTLQAKDYLNSKDICGDNLTDAIKAALDGQPLGTAEEITADSNVIYKNHLDSDGNIRLDEDGNPLDPYIILETGVARPDGLKVESMQVVWEGITDYPSSEDWDKMGHGRVLVRMSYCERGGNNCDDEKRKSIDRAIPLKEIYAETDDDGYFQRAICSSSQDGILNEAKRMVDEVQRQVCQLAFANAALNGDTSENPDCGTIVEIKDAEGVKITSAGSGTLTAPLDMNLKECRFKGVVPGTMKMAISGAGGGGYGSDKNSCGTGGKAGDFLTDNIFMSIGNDCRYVVGRGGDPGNTSSSISGASGGQKGGTSSLTCNGIVIASVEGGGTGSKNNGCTYGGSGENSEFYKYYHGVDGGGGRGAKAKSYDADPGSLGGGGGGGAEKKAGKSARKGGKGGDGALIVTWKEYTVMPNNNIHDCAVCEPGTVLDENGECAELCDGYGEVYNEESHSCECGGNTVPQGGSCVSCSSSYAYGSVSNGSSCSCPNGGFRAICGDQSICLEPGQSCSNGSGGGGHGPTIK